MTKFKLLAPFLCLLLLLSGSVCADGLKFGIIAKSVDDGNFIDVWRGCMEVAERSGDTCVLLGPRGGSHVRNQVKSINDAVAKADLDAFAVSVTSSSLVAAAIKNIDVPVITFDSPLAENDKDLSLAYIGIDNVQFGRDLAKIAKEIRPQGGTVCMMSALHDTNLAQRVTGVRRELSGDADFSGDKRLSGEGGWKETSRCPWDSGDSVKRSLDEVAYTFSKLKPDVFIAVGWWPILDSASYRAVVEPFAEELRLQRRLVIVGVGKILPEFKALLDDGLAHGYVSIDFVEIGRLIYETMKNATEDRAVPQVRYIPNVIAVSEK